MDLPLLRISSSNFALPAILFTLLFFLYALFTSFIHGRRNRLPPQPVGAWPVIGHLPLLTGKELLHNTLGKFADTYGPIFMLRFGTKKTLIVSGWEVAKECFTINDKIFASRPKFAAAQLLGYNYAMFGTSPYGSHWRHIRKIVMLELLGNHRMNRLQHISISTCLAMILGGFHTTTAEMVWALSLLLKHEEALKKVQLELDERVGRERQVNESDINDLVYLQAVVKEALRLYPAAQLSVPHESIEDCTVAGYHVPAGTRLWVNLYKLQRDPNVWESPTEFCPERFLTSEKNYDVNGQTPEFIPFGSGRRICPGISFAIQVMHLTLARLLHEFQIGLPTQEPINMEEIVGLNITKKVPLEVVLTPRLSPPIYK